MTTAILSGFLGTLLSLAATNDPAASPIGRFIEDFTLSNHSGQKFSLEEHRDAKAIVVVFVGGECPLVQQYLPRVAEISRQFENKGVVVLCIDSNVQDSPSEMAAFARKVNISVPILMDPEARIADAFGARRTPEVFVLDQQRVVRYRGRIDDQFEIGVQRPRPTRSDLISAIQEVLEGKTVSVPETRVIGCIIGRASRKTVEQPTVTYAQHVEPIFRARCIECHRSGEISPFVLTNYEESKAWGETVAEIVDEHRMPPWFANPKYGHFSNETQMPDSERTLIRKWVDEGCPSGDLSKVPPLPQFVEGWTLGLPDKVYDMGDDFHIPATGAIGYKHYTIDPKFTEDMWVISSEAKPVLGVRFIISSSLPSPQEGVSVRS